MPKAEENKYRILYNQISLFIKIYIKNDFEYNNIEFIKKYCNIFYNNIYIKEEFHNVKFLFIFDCTFLTKDNIGDYIRSIDYYSELSNSIKNLKLIIKYKIDNPDKYCFIEELYISLLLKFKNSDFEIVSELPLLEENKELNMQNLHEATLLYSKIKNNCKKFSMYISGNMEDKYKIISYMASIKSKNLHIYYNNEPLKIKIESAGRIPPTIFIENAKDFFFFQNPLEYKIWEKIIAKKNNNIIQINKDTFVNINESANKYWPYLRMCQKFLLEKFEETQSKVYTNIRNYVFTNKKFYDNYVKKMPFLAVCIFSLYDNFYRNHLLHEFKKESKISVLEERDILLSEQKNQNWLNFSIYEKLREKYDIKNFLIDKKNFILHKTVESEIFEAINLAEGLLQILENAFLHAGGGILSMRIYNRSKGILSNENIKEDHIQYLNRVYGSNYFDYIKANFFLEVQISDLSSVSISQKYIKNYEKNDKIKLLFSENKEIINLKYFFKPNEDQNDIKKRFYNMTRDNIVHHYGLEIFNSILTSRKGILSVVGHGDGYDNLNEIYNKIYAPLEKYVADNKTVINKIVEIFKRNDSSNNQSSLYEKRQEEIQSIRQIIQNAKSRLGTTYRILLPLNHFSVLTNSYVDNAIIEKENIKYLTSNIPIIIDIETLIHNKEIKLKNPKDKKYEIKDKQNNINMIEKIIHSIYKDNSEFACICINMGSMGKKQDSDTNDIEEKEIVEENINMYFEVIIKGVLLFLLKQSGLSCGSKTLPLAIVNLSSFHLIEATRIISMYYTKKSSIDGENYFENTPIYLKSDEVGKEIVFEGKDIVEVKNRIIKTAMTNGMMFSELMTIIDILKKVEKSNKEYE